MRDAPRVGIVFAAWDPAASRASLDRIVRMLGPVSEVTSVAVGNAAPAIEAVTDLADLVVAGSNEDAEFSAYDEGLRILHADRRSLDVLLLANDRAFSYPLDMRESGTARLLDNVRRHQLAVGHVDALPRPMEVLGRRVHAYLRSNLVLLPFASVRPGLALTSLAAARFDDLVPVAYPGDCRLDGLGSPDYADFLRGWLTGTRDQDAWYRARPADAASWPELRLKAKSIVNEHLLSVRLEDAGLELVPFGLGSRPIVGTRPGRMLARAVRPDRTQRWRLRKPR